jgi:uncharacterized protein (TIGR02466 family)
MKQLEILSYPVYEFSCDENLVNDVKKHIEQISHKDIGQVGTSQLFDNYYHKELFQFFNVSVTTVKNLYYKKSIEFPIVACWANKYNMMQRMNDHTHSNGVISGLFYVTTHEDSAPTLFNINNPWTDFYDSPYHMLHMYDEPKFVTSKIYPKAGTLLLFPSHMKHSVMTMKKIETRYTISFNCFPKGVIGEMITGRLTLDTLSVEDKIKSNEQK